MTGGDKDQITRLRLQGYTPERIAELILWRVELIRYILKKKGLCE